MAAPIIRKRDVAPAAPTKKRRNSHIFAPAEHGWYIEPRRIVDALLRVQDFDHNQLVLDPCCGSGTIVIAARAAGYDVVCADVVDRGFPGTRVQNFFDRGSCAHTVLTNPPFEIAQRVVEHAFKIGARKVGILFPIAQICGVRSAWIYAAPLHRVFAIGPRPSLLPGHNVAAGQKAGGGRKDFCWLIFDAGYTGPAEIRHLVTNVEG